MRVKYWEIYAENLGKTGWSGAGGCVSGLDSDGQTIWIADAARGEGKRFVVHADEKLTAFWNWKGRFALAADCFDRLASFFQTRRRRTGLESGGRTLPARFFASF